MKKLILALSIISSSNLIAITTGSALFINHATGKKIVFINDAHSKFIRLATKSTEDKALHAQLFEAHYDRLTHLADAIVGLDEAHGKQTVVITETSANSFGSSFEQEAGAAAPQLTETIEAAPRCFLRHIIAAGTTPEEKTAIFTSRIEPFNGISTASFSLANKARWIAGDRARTQQDFDLSFTILEEQDNIKNALEAGEEIPENLRSLTIHMLKEYTTALHQQFQEYGICDAYHDQLSLVIEQALATGNITEDDHIALLYAHLEKTDQAAARDTFNNNLLCFISQKLDCELNNYFDAFNSDANLTYAFFIMGAAHNEYIAKQLISQGYTKEMQAGLESIPEATSREDILAILISLDGLETHIDAEAIFTE